MKIDIQYNIEGNLTEGRIGSTLSGIVVYSSISIRGDRLQEKDLNKRQIE